MRLLKINARIVGPKIPVSTKDPVGATTRLNKMLKQISRRHKEMKIAVIDLFRTIPAVAVNADASGNYEYRYDFSSIRAASFNDELQRLIDGVMLDDAKPSSASQLWASIEVSSAYAAGVVMAQQQLSAMSSVYADRRTIADIVYSDGYLQRLAIANASTYSDWAGLSDAARNDLAQTIMGAIATGKNPRDVEAEIVARTGVSESRAQNIAQTEITGILRKSQSDEVQEAKVTLGIHAALFWISALLPTTRMTHAIRSGNYYSPEEVADFYGRDGNRWRCHCSQTPCLLDENGRLVILDSSLQRVIDAKDKWISSRKAA